MKTSLQGELLIDAARPSFTGGYFYDEEDFPVSYEEYIKIGIKVVGNYFIVGLERWSLSNEMTAKWYSSLTRGCHLDLSAQFSWKLLQQIENRMKFEFKAPDEEAFQFELDVVSGEIAYL